MEKLTKEYSESFYNLIMGVALNTPIIRGYLENTKHNYDEGTDLLFINFEMNQKLELMVWISKRTKRCLVSLIANGCFGTAFMEVLINFEKICQKVCNNYLEDERKALEGDVK